jgi:hypothetical protein
LDVGTAVNAILLDPAAAVVSTFTGEPPGIPVKTAVKARNVLRRKQNKTPLEDALAAHDGARAAQLAEWARRDFDNYRSGLAQWREHRRMWRQEAQDSFKHREKTGSRYDDGRPAVFQTQNDSLNVIGGLAEFAAAQAEQDLFGGEPWFAAAPVGRSDRRLADTLQKHLQWTFRDGRKVQTYGSAISRAAALGEVFTKTCYHVETDFYEEEIQVLHADGEPLLVEGDYVTEARAAALETSGGLQARGTLEWRPIYQQRERVLHQGTETLLLDFEDVAFREDAPALDLRYTNFYHVVEMTALEAQRRFGLSRQDALRLAQAANTRHSASAARESGALPADSLAEDLPEAVFGDEETERLLNSRVRLIEGFVMVDPLGDGIARRLHLILPATPDTWLVSANYLANVSPNAELPVKVHVWEEVPNRLYGRGFFAKYQHVQRQVDDLWNQIGYRNRLHANPVTGYHPDKLESDEEDPDLELAPGLALKLKADARLGEAIEFLALPDLDSRSMELLQLGVQMVQLRSGITSASQGDLNGVPESNTATGIRQLMSRAAVLLKKPIRGLRRSLGRDFSYTVKLHYANFDRAEAFVWGEGDNAELLTLTPDMVRDLDIDVRMLLTQEQNQTKLEGATTAMRVLGEYIALPEAEKAAARPLCLQAIKALEFEGADEIVRQPALKLEDVLQLLPQEEQERVAAVMQAREAPPPGAGEMPPGAGGAADETLAMPGEEMNTEMQTAPNAGPAEMMAPGIASPVPGAGAPPAA